MKLLVLAGGFDQIALIKELKQKHNYILLADYYKNPPAKEYADKFYNISTLDEKSILNLAKEEKVDLITTACTDQALLTMARISEKLGLPCYLNSNQALAITNKYYMKQVFMDNNIQTAQFYILDKPIEIDKQIKKINFFPAIVKPCDCNSSKGVTKVNNINEFKIALQDAYALSRSKKVIVEEYIEGVEVSVDVWIEDKKTNIISISETKKLRENEHNFTIYASSYPVFLDAKQKVNLKNEVIKISRSFKLYNGPLLVQAIIRNDDVYVVEFSARMGGGTKYRLIEYMTGINIMKKYVDFILTGNAKIPIVKKSEQNYRLIYLYANNGTIKKFEGFNEIVTSKIAEEVYIYKKEKEKISQRLTSGDRIAGILISGKNQVEIDNKIKIILSVIKVLDVYDNNMIFLHDYGER